MMTRTKGPLKATLATTGGGDLFRATASISRVWGQNGRGYWRGSGFWAFFVWSDHLIGHFRWHLNCVL